MQTFEIVRKDDEQRIVFGWASVVVNPDGSPVVDLQDEVIRPAELEKAAYDYVLKSRDGGVMHEETGVAKLVASLVTTPEIVKALFPNVHDGAIPIGWVVAYKILKEHVWKRIKNGELTAFSIGGRGTRVPVEV